MVNTFCHGVAPVGVSLIRSLLGAGLGLCLGLVAVAIAEGSCAFGGPRAGNPFQRMKNWILLDLHRKGRTRNAGASFGVF